MAEQSDTVASVKLQVAGAQGPDVGKGVARLSREALEQLNLRQGDVVELSGKRVTAALALPPYQEDEGLAIVRLDGLMRANAGTGIGDHVEIRRAQVKPASRVVLAPAQQKVRSEESRVGDGEGERWE